MKPRLLFAKLLRGISKKIFRLSQRVEYWGCKPDIFRYIDCLDTIYALLKHTQPTCICDIGANAGHWTSVLYEMNPRLKHVVFVEPQAKYLASLQKLTLPGVTKVIHPCGLGEKSERRLIKGGTASASFLQADQQFDHFPDSLLEHQEEEVDLITLDKLYADSNHPIPDVIKIDVQGLELEVLKGGINLLRKTKVLVIELSFRQFYKGQPSLSEVLKFLEDHSFVMIDRGYEGKSWTNSRETVQQDAIFLNTKYV
jgi:FkbM family methyltransferase